MANEKTLFTVRPSMWRNEPIRFCFHIGFALLGTFLFFAGAEISEHWMPEIPKQILPIAGFVIGGITALKFFIWWIRSISTRLVVATKQVVRYEGIIARHMVQMRHGNIQNVYVKQTIFQRLMRCGVVGFSSSGQADVEIVVNGIPDPNNVAAKIQAILDREDASLIE